MIGFDHLGNLGRLGNQMFEYAALRGIGKEHGYDICIPPSDHEGIENYSLHECFNLDHIPTGFVNNKNINNSNLSFKNLFAELGIFLIEK